MKRFLSLFMSVLMVFSCFAGSITTAQASSATPTPGDINGDGNVNTKDLTRLLKFVSGEDVEVVAVTLDTNGDGNVNTKDLSRLMGYLSGDPNKPLPDIGCSHEMTATPASEATCTEEGNIAYWYCSKCEKYFSDAEGAREITLEETVVAKVDHALVTIPGYPATMTETGLTDSIKCSNCDYVEKEHSVIPISEFEIEYVIGTGDTYITKLYQEGKIDNSSNPVTYSSDAGVARLEELEVAGYIFEGWYDASGSSGQLVRRIEPGTAGKIKLYAKWSLISYDLIFDSPDVPVENKSFTVNKSVPLHNIELQGYTFIGWSIKDIVINPKDGSVFSDNGKIITEIPVGTANDVVVHANWTSNRNFVRPVSKLDDPLFAEDMDNNQLIFIYKIGTIENVPLYSIADLPNSAGLTWEIESDVTKSIDKTTAQEIANTVSKATTTTAGWTLSEEWNDVTTATNETGSENSKTQGQIDEVGTVSGQQWYVSNSKGGAFTSSASAGGSSSTNAKITDNASWGLENAVTTEVSGSRTNTHQTELNASYTESQKDTFDWKLGGSIGGGNEVSAGANASAGKEGVASAGVSAGAKKTTNWGINGEIGGSTEKSNSATISGGVVDTQSATIAAARSQGVTATMNGSVGTEVGSVSENHYETSATSESNWNSTTGYEQSETVSKNQTTSQAISELVYNKHGISASTSVGGSDVKTESTGRTSETQDQYTSTVEYSESEITTLKQKLTNVGSGNGYYRVVQAATAHVYAVVGFDIATQSFYTTTHTIVDNKSAKVFIDHSRKSSSFDDCENGLLEFEIPFDLYKFTTRAMMRSDGLKINYATGEVERYEGSGKNVVIPEYAVDYNSDTGKYSVTKVTSINANAFRDKDDPTKANTNITGVILPDYITEIPAGTFEGCTNLQSVVSYGVSKIGENAFKNCTSLKHFSVDRFVTTLGKNAFENVESIDVVAANAKVVDAAISSGAKNISVDVSYVKESLDNKEFVIGAIESFRFIGAEDKEYVNLSIVSDAQKTTLANLTLKGNTGTPVKFSSSIVSISSVSIVDAPGFAIIFTSDNVDLIVDGINNLSSQSANAVLCKGLSIVEQNSGSVGKINIAGNVLAYTGQINGTKFVNLLESEIKYITEDEYMAYLTSIEVTFNANGGAIPDGQTSKTVNYGQPYGDLPTPTKEGWTFEGWYTAKNDGNKITATTKVTSASNQTLYALWQPNSYSVIWSTGTGYSITVSRKSSPNAGASMGTLSSGATVYYGDVLWITYNKKDYYTIKAHGATEITVTGNITSSHIYATAELNPVLDWVKSSEIPSGAQVVNTKWSYVLREYTTDSVSSLTGWEKYDTQRTGWGATQGPVYYDPSNGSRNVWSESYETGRTHYYRYYRYANASGSSGSYESSATYYNYQYWDLTYPLTIASSYNGFRYYHDAPNGNTVSGKYYTVWYSHEWDDVYYGTRWYYQEPVYTYYYYRDVSKESTTDPTGQSNVSNIVKWVQYREK